MIVEVGEDVVAPEEVVRGVFRENPAAGEAVEVNYRTSDASGLNARRQAKSIRLADYLRPES
jgi:hypothetical protein